ncbi:MAG: hypothetical protein E7565_01455 [Ruminococcaceae bacterium]|nr:hypothetical protein [Oscillospiraceae bacterium]
MFKSKFLRITAIVLLSLFLLHQVYSVIYKPINTETAEYVSVTDGISFTGMIIRNEVLIDKADGGVMHLMVSDGERISKDGVIAKIFSSEKDSFAVTEIEKIKEQISNIKTIQGYNDIAAVDIDLLENKITSSLGDVLFHSGNGDYSGARKNQDLLLTLMNRKEMVIGNSTDFSAQLESLETRKSSLEASLSEPVDSITAVESGFFVSSVDGYETVLGTDNLERFTPEYLNSVVADESKNVGKIGKIVSDYTWYIAAPLTANQSLSYKKGDTVTIKTQLKSNPYIKVVVEQINLSADRESTVILFSCQEMNAELAAMRTGAMTIINGEFNGLKVSKSALRVSDNQTGVYIISGMELKFVLTKVIYQTDDYVICEKADTNQNTQLRLYDKVVVKGRNLYDGKIIN